MRLPKWLYGLLYLHNKSNLDVFRDSNAFRARSQYDTALPPLLPLHKVTKQVEPFASPASYHHLTAFRLILIQSTYCRKLQNQR